jgi:hypothetical protein
MSASTPRYRNDHDRRGLAVGRIGYGAMQLSGAQVWGEAPTTTAGSH